MKRIHAIVGRLRRRACVSLSSTVPWPAMSRGPLPRAETRSVAGVSAVSVEGKAALFGRTGAGLSIPPTAVAWSAAASGARAGAAAAADDNSKAEPAAGALPRALRVVLRPFGAAPAAPTAVVGAFPATMAPAAAVPSASATGANDADAAAAMAAATIGSCLGSTDLLVVPAALRVILRGFGETLFAAGMAAPAAMAL